MRQIHNLKPIYNNESKILILGSFPSIISRTNNFYYENKINRFWKVLEVIFNTHLVLKEEKISFLLNNNIALWDVINSCEINNSSDSSIKNVIPNDIGLIIEKSNVKTIFTNGKKAYNLYKRYLSKSLDINVISLPSTSSANASYSLEQLIKEYKVVLEYLKK